MQDIGLIGLAVMGQNLVLNMAEKGWRVSVFNRTTLKVEDFIARKPKELPILGFSDLGEFLKSLSCPRKVMLMVKAGAPVDELIGQILPFLEQGDVLIDGGNSDFKDTERRVKYLEEKGILFLGVGVSGWPVEPGGIATAGVLWRHHSQQLPAWP